MSLASSIRCGENFVQSVVASITDSSNLSSLNHYFSALYLKLNMLSPAWATDACTGETSDFNCTLVETHTKLKVRLLWKSFYLMWPQSSRDSVRGPT